MLTHSMTIYKDGYVVFEGTGTAEAVAIAAGGALQYNFGTLIQKLLLHSTIEHDSGDTITHITRFALSTKDLTKGEVS
jgi:hypothetical protein